MGKQLRAIYALGEKLLAMPEAVRGKEHSLKLAEAAGRKRAWYYKVKRFAATYTKHQLDELCRLPNVTWGHVLLLQNVKNRKQRSRLQKQASKNHWTFNQLYAAIRKKHPAQPRGCRPFTGARDPNACFKQLVSLSDRWVYYCERVIPPILKRVKSSLPGEVPEGLGKGLVEAVKALKKLDGKCDWVRKRLQRLAGEISQGRKPSFVGRKARE